MSGARVVVVSIVAASLAFGGAWFAIRVARDGGAEAAAPEDGEVSVAAVIGLGVDQQVRVRGYVFVDGQTGPILCSQTTGGSRPACEGDLVRLLDLDQSRLALEVADEGEGGYDAWSQGEVVLLGTTVGGAGLRVEDVLPT